MIQVYKGKVRDTFTNGQQIVLVATNRISAFDKILPKTIPYKGAVLNLMSAHFLNLTKEIVPNWLLDVPNPYVSVGKYCQTIPIEVIVRGYITGSMWRAYECGEREFCGQKLPEGLSNFQQLPQPILTPTTKATEGHDENSSRAEIISKKILTEEEWSLIENYALKIYEFGNKYAASKNLILADTKIEFGKTINGEILVIDEILTPDSSRYFMLDSYSERLEKNQAPIQLSKEFVRQWLIENGFMGMEHQEIPEMTEIWVDEISQKYIALYEQIMGETFDKEANKWDGAAINNLVNKLLTK